MTVMFTQKRIVLDTEEIETLYRASMILTAIIDEYEDGGEIVIEDISNMPVQDILKRADCLDSLRRK